MWRNYSFLSLIKLYSKIIIKIWMPMKFIVLTQLNNLLKKLNSLKNINFFVTYLFSNIISSISLFQEYEDFYIICLKNG